MRKRLGRISAEPLRLILRDDGYYLVVNALDGPQAVLGKLIEVKLSSIQLEVINNWNPTDDETCLLLTDLP